MEEGTIIRDLTLIVATAGIVTVVFKSLRLPLLLGYLLSGVLVGPHFLLKGIIHETHTITELSELGVAFLMFYIGLEFDLKKLRSNLGPAFLAVSLQTITMLIVGSITAPLLGWSSINGLFLGCLLAISSTMITFPILRSQNALQSNFGQAAIGALILEDILAILVLVILTGVAVRGHFELGDATKVTFLVGVFVVMVFIIGKLLAPKLLRLIKKFGEPEMITVISVGLLLGIGELANHFNFSIALGAFLAGSILSQNELAEEIEAAIEPLRNLFTAVFFVTIGMLIDPAALYERWEIVLALTFAVVFGKTVTVFLGLFLSGTKPRVAFQAASCKAQIGEFSFVIASLGLKLGITEPDLMTLAVGVALGSIVIIPPFANSSLTVYTKICHYTPSGLKTTARLYLEFFQATSANLRANTFLSLIRKPVLMILTYFLIFNGILISAFLLVTQIAVYPQLDDYAELVRYAIWGTAAVLILPFFITIVRNLEVIVLLTTETVFSNQASTIFKKSRFRNILNTILLAIVVTILGGIYLSAAAPFLPKGLALTVFVCLLCGLSIMLWRQAVRVNSKLEKLFLKNFNTEVRSKLEQSRQAVLKVARTEHPWPVDIHDVIIRPNALVCGKLIRDLDLRDVAGVTIVGLSRGKSIVYDPHPCVPLFSGDHVLFIGNEQQAQQATQILAATVDSEPEAITPTTSYKIKIDQLFLPPESPYAGLSLAQANFRKQFGITVIGIQRGDKQITSMKPDEILKPEDILIVVGSLANIEKFKNN